MSWNQDRLSELRRRYGSGQEETRNVKFSKVMEQTFSSSGTRLAPYAGIQTFLGAPYLVPDDPRNLVGLDVALVGVPIDLGVSNRSGSRFGPRAVRGVERIGPFNHVLNCSPIFDLKVADIGDVPFSSRYRLETSHQDISHFYQRLVDAQVAPLSVGGDHSISHPILKAIGGTRPVGLIHIDAHCDTGGPFDDTKFHHGGPFRNAVLDGVLDPTRTVQIGIRGSSEYLWEFSYESGMTVIHAEDVVRMGIDAVVAKAREVVGNGPTYLSFDIDSLDPSFAPGTGTPEVGGLSTRDVLGLLHGLQGVNLCGGDVVEVAPQYDPTSNTAQAGAQVLFEILSLMAFSPGIAGRAG